MSVAASIRICACLSVMALGSPCVRAENWWGFRGPTGLGYTTERNLPNSWGGEHQENVHWRAPLVGEGHASPIVWGDRVFVCTARWADNVRKREEVIPEHHLLCYAAADGKLVWDTRVPPGPWLRTDFRSGPGGGYAAPTPATDGKRVYVVFGSAVIAAIDFDGHVAWRQVIKPHTFDVTIGSSPVLFQDALLMLCAMANKSDSRLVSYDKANGVTRWEAPLPETGFGHSTPVHIQVGGQSQLSDHRLSSAIWFIVCTDPMC